MIEIRWHGRGGQGSFTASKLLGVAASLYGGKYALAFPSFGPERRGAPVVAFTKIDNKKITNRSEIDKCDYIVILDETLFHEDFLKDLKKNGKIIINTHRPQKYEKYNSKAIVTIDATSIALEILKKPITNTAMLGALVGVSDMVSLDSVIKGMGDFLKGPLLQRNIEVVESAFLQSKEAGV